MNAVGIAQERKPQPIVGAGGGGALGHGALSGGRVERRRLWRQTAVEWSGIAARL
jgi:hypothetical protein